jgi:uncharacterized protein (DUF305 family)
MQRLLLPAALTATLSLAACGGAAGHQVQAGPAPAPEPSKGAQIARTDSLRRPYTEADIRFMTDMIGHHSQAITMSGWAPSHGADASIQTLAARIVNAQQDEIATMQQWLRERSQPVPEPDSGMAGHQMHHMLMPVLMPGMLTPAQMQQLDQARGPAFDRLFLTSMIQHHRGAVSMVEALFATPGAARDETVFKFANDVNGDQSTEIARMETMLAALPPQ